MEKNNKGLKVALIVFIMLTVLLSCYIVYDKVFKGKEEPIVNNNENNNTEQNNKEPEPVEENNTPNEVVKAYTEEDFKRATKITLIKEPECNGNDEKASLIAEINDNKNINISRSFGAEEVIVGNTKYLFGVDNLTCNDVKLYYIT